MPTQDEINLISGRSLAKTIEAGIADWFTLAPTHRTKEKLIRMIRVSLGINS